MTTTILKIYGTLDGNIVSILMAKVQEDDNPSFCTRASGRGPINLPALASDSECIPVEIAPFMWILDDELPPPELDLRIDVPTAKAPK